MFKVINERVEAKATWCEDATGDEDHHEDGIGYVIDFFASLGI